jgi:hypothetical protein
MSRIRTRSRQAGSRLGRPRSVVTPAASAAGGTPKERRFSSDTGGSAAVKRAPTPAYATPNELAFVMPHVGEGKLLVQTLRSQSVKNRNSSFADSCFTCRAVASRLSPEALEAEPSSQSLSAQRPGKCRTTALSFGRTFESERRNTTRFIDSGALECRVLYAG